MLRRRLVLPLLLLGCSAVTPAPASATFSGRNGQIAWSIFSAGDSRHRGYARLSLVSPQGRLRVAARCLGAAGAVCGDWGNLSFSPDGRQLVWDELTARGQRSLVLATADGSAPRLLTHDGRSDFMAAFTPDGQGIVFVQGTPGSPSPSGTLISAPLTSASARAIGTVWGDSPRVTPSGQEILFLRMRARSTDLWSVRSDGTRLHRLLAGVVDFDLSPGGSRIAYLASAGGLWLARADGTRFRLLARRGDRGLEAVRFSPDGRRLLFAEQSRPGRRSSGEALYTVGIRGGPRRLLVNTHDARALTLGLAWQPTR